MKLRRGLTAPGNGLGDNRDVCKFAASTSAAGKSALGIFLGKPRISPFAQIRGVESLKERRMLKTEH